MKSDIKGLCKKVTNKLQGKWPIIAILLIACVILFISTKYLEKRTEATSSEVAQQNLQTQQIAKQKEEQEDPDAPKITLIGNKEIWVDSFKKFEDPGYKASDDKDGDLTSKVTQKVTTKKRGKIYEISYSVENSLRKFAKETRTVKVREGIVYLTFDDGPSKDITPKILDILKEKNVQATFFVIADNWNASLVKREVNEGHTVGLHGYSHTYQKIYKSLDSLVENYTKIHELVKDATGIDAKYIRFPGGTSNRVSKNYCEGIMTKAVKKIEEMGYVEFDWNVDSDDAGSAKTSKQIYNNVIKGIKKGRTNVVLMHDRPGMKATLGALENIINYCNENMFELRAIDSNTPVVQHEANN